MRKGNRFTPARLGRWADSGRGVGARGEYEPWHQVTRDDPGSCGRSHLLRWRFPRLIHLLSDQELVAFGFATMLPGLVDLREQFPLSLDSGPHELEAYQSNAFGAMFPGTLDIATNLGHRHPYVSAGANKAHWTFSTDLLLTLSTMQGALELLAVSVKSKEDLSGKRKRELLAIEREYWVCRGVTWLLITPDLFSRSVVLGIRAGLPWQLGEGADEPLSAEERRVLQRVP